MWAICDFYKKFFLKKRKVCYDYNNEMLFDNCCRQGCFTINLTKPEATYKLENNCLCRQSNSMNLLRQLITYFDK